MIFETNRLIIRKVKEPDKKTMLEFHNDEETMRFVSFQPQNWTMDELNKKLKINRTLYKIGFGIYGIESKAEHKVIGEASVFNSFLNIRTPELGYILHRKYWNRGYGTEVVTGLIGYCVEILKSEKIIARMYSENIFSARICEKAGMQLVDDTILKNGKHRLTYEFRNV